MSHKVAWHESANLIFASFKGTSTLDDSLKANNQQVKLLEQSSGQVIMLVDLSQLQETEGSLAQLRDMLTVLRHPNLSYVLVIKSSSRIVSFLSSAVNQLMRVRFNNYNSQAEAVAFIQKHYNETDAFGRELEIWLEDNTVV